jgi:choline monooxygenase
VLVVSTLHPQGPDKTLNVVEFFYPEEICAFERDHRGANSRLHGNLRGRRRNRTAHGRRPQGAATTSSAPTKAPWKMGMQHFHERVRCEMGAKTNVIGFETTQKHLKTSF